MSCGALFFTAHLSEACRRPPVGMSVLSGEGLRFSTWLVFLWSVAFAFPVSLAALKLDNHDFRQFHVHDWNSFAHRLSD